MKILYSCYYKEHNIKIIVRFIMIKNDSYTKDDIKGTLSIMNYESRLGVSESYEMEIAMPYEVARTVFEIAEESDTVNEDLIEDILQNIEHYPCLEKYKIELTSSNGFLKFFESFAVEISDKQYTDDIKDEEITENKFKSVISKNITNLHMCNEYSYEPIESEDDLYFEYIVE